MALIDEVTFFNIYISKRNLSLIGVICAFPQMSRAVLKLIASSYKCVVLIIFSNLKD